MPLVCQQIINVYSSHLFSNLCWSISNINSLNIPCFILPTDLPRYFLNFYTILFCMAMMGIHSKCVLCTYMQLRWFCEVSTFRIELDSFSGPQVKDKKRKRICTHILVVFFHSFFLIYFTCSSWRTIQLDSEHRTCYDWYFQKKQREVIRLKYKVHTIFWLCRITRINVTKSNFSVGKWYSDLRSLQCSYYFLKMYRDNNPVLILNLSEDQCKLHEKYNRQLPSWFWEIGVWYRNSDFNLEVSESCLELHFSIRWWKIYRH